MSKQTDQFLWLEIRPQNGRAGFKVVGMKRCQSGVMKGQTLPHYIESFDTWDEAAAAYPDASGDSGHRPSYHHLPEDDDPPVGIAGRMKSNGEYHG